MAPGKVEIPNLGQTIMFHVPFVNLPGVLLWVRRGDIDLLKFAPKKSHGESEVVGMMCLGEARFDEPYPPRNKQTAIDSPWKNPMTFLVNKPSKWWMFP